MIFLQQLNIGLIPVAATELVAGVSGESEERIRDLFEQAVALAPCVLFIDGKSLHFFHCLFIECKYFLLLQKSTPFHRTD